MGLIQALEVAFSLDQTRYFVISDRDKILQRAIELVWPNINASVCLWHLEKNIKTRHRTDFGKKLWPAAFEG